LLLLLLFFSCDNATNENRIEKFDKVKADSIAIIDKVKPANEIQNFEIKIEKGFSKLSSTGYLSDKLLISKNGKLRGFKKLNIKGHKLYTLDREGNITATYDISNNYSVYTYDNKNRLIKSENKNHSPPEVYYDVEYKYSKQDSLIEKKITSYRKNIAVKRDIIRDKTLLNKKGMNKVYFENRLRNDHYINKDKGEIITYADKMIFCCGLIMKGKNKLTYYFNKHDLIDSLVIEGMESKEIKKFEYEYEKHQVN